MQAIVETVFDAVYLVSVITIGILDDLLAARGSQPVQAVRSDGCRSGAGGLVHLIPRALAPMQPRACKTLT